MADVFLPKNYEVPEKPSNFTKLTEGTHRLRILTSPMLGWELWEDNGDKKDVVRFAYDAPHPMKSRHFWAMVVWNYDVERIQILSVTQSSIQNQLKALAANPDWGSPLNYNITISRTGQGLNDTKYRVDGSPTSINKPLPEKIQKAFKDANVDLNKWLAGEEAFSENETTENRSIDEVFPDRVDAPVKDAPIDTETAEVDDLPF